MIRPRSARLHRAKQIHLRELLGGVPEYVKHLAEYPCAKIYALRDQSGELLMSTIDLDGLPEPVIQSLKAMVACLKQEYAKSSDALDPLERMKRAAGGWNDDSDGLEEYLEEVRRSRGHDRQGST